MKPFCLLILSLVLLFSCSQTKEENSVKVRYFRQIYQNNKLEFVGKHEILDSLANNIKCYKLTYINNDLSSITKLNSGFPEKVDEELYSKVTFERKEDYILSRYYDEFDRPVKFEGNAYFKRFY